MSSISFPRAALAARAQYCLTYGGSAITALALLCTSMAASAQTSANPTTLPTVNVLGWPLLEAERLEQTAPIVSQTREQFEKLPNDRASDVIGRMPGVVLGGPPGEKKSLHLRGISGDYSRVQIDGVQLPSSGQTRTFELMNLPASLFDNIAIIRNPTAEYEADGLAGRVALTSRRLGDKPELNGRVAFGGVDEIDASTGQASLAYGSKLNEHFGMIGAVNFDRRTITKTKRFSERTFSGGPGGAGFLRDEDEPKTYTNSDMFLDLVRSYDGGEVHLKPLYLREEAELDKQRDQYRRATGLFNDRTLTSARETTQTAGLTAEHKHEFNSTYRYEALFGYAQTGFDSNNRETALTSALAFNSGSREQSEIEDGQYHAAAKLIAALPGTLPQELRFGGNLRFSDRSSDREVFTLDAAGNQSQSLANQTASRNSDYNIEERYYALFVQDEIKLTSRLTATPGLRLEVVEDDLAGGNGTRFERRFIDLMPSLPISYRLNDSLTLRGAVSRLLNRPKFDEIAPGVTVRGANSFNGNPQLNPARAWGLDVGLDYATPDLFLGINLYGRHIKDIIEQRETSANQYTYSNFAKGQLYGLELEQRFRLSQLGWDALAPLQLLANQTFIASEVDDPVTGKRPFAEQPDYVANIGLEWSDRQAGTVISLMANITGKRPTISHDGAGAIRRKFRASELFLDAHLEQQVVEGVSVFLSAENLTNQERDEVEYVNGGLNRLASIATGRVFYLGTRFRF